MARRGRQSQVERQLRERLYRFDCPAPLAIGEYVLDVLEGRSRIDLARHVLECDLCADELNGARAFLASGVPAPPPPPGVWQALRRTIASLFVPPASPAFGALRGDAPGLGTEYRAGPLKIVIAHVAGAQHGRVSIDGLILRDDAPLDAVADCQVALYDQQRPIFATRTDDLGSFAFEDIKPGTYAIEVTLAEEIVVVEDLHIDC